MLARLVDFDTTSDKSNRQLTDFVRQYLSAYDVPIIEVSDATSDKVAILATIGPMRDGGIILSGHTDVVPAVDQPWTSNSFTPHRDNDRLIGRGYTDMKGFCAAVLAAVPDLTAASLKRPVHILFSYDEETNGLGSVELIRAFARTHPPAVDAVVGEPTGMRVATAHKSIATYIIGIEAHSSNPNRGVSAISLGCEIIRFLEAHADWLRRFGPRDDRFDPPCTTVQIGRMSGGTATNIVPGQCWLDWDVRGAAGLDVDDVRRALDG